jgi:hypothetical protein
VLDPDAGELGSEPAVGAGFSAGVLAELSPAAEGVFVFGGVVPFPGSDASPDPDSGPESEAGAELLGA